MCQAAMMSELSVLVASDVQYEGKRPFLVPAIEFFTVRTATCHRCRILAVGMQCPAVYLDHDCRPVWLLPLTIASNLISHIPLVADSDPSANMLKSFVILAVASFVAAQSDDNPSSASVTDDEMGPAAFMWPPDRVWSGDMDNRSPCGSRASAGNRTEFPLCKCFIPCHASNVGHKFSWTMLFPLCRRPSLTPRFQLGAPSLLSPRMITTIQSLASPTPTVSSQQPFIKSASMSKG